MYVCLYVCLSVCMYVTYVYIHMDRLYMQIYIYIYIYVCVCIIVLSCLDTVVRFLPWKSYLRTSLTRTQAGAKAPVLRSCAESMFPTLKFETTDGMAVAWCRFILSWCSHHCWHHCGCHMLSSPLLPLTQSARQWSSSRTSWSSLSIPAALIWGWSKPDSHPCHHPIPVQLHMRQWFEHGHLKVYNWPQHR